MIDYTQLIIGLCGGLVGGVIVALVQHFLDKRKEIAIGFNKLMEEKYRGLLVFMACSIDIDKKKYFTLNEQVGGNSEEHYLNQVKEYYYHSILYSPDKVILALKAFIEKPNQENYVQTAKAMRMDLWGKGTRLSYEDLKIE